MKLVFHILSYVGRIIPCGMMSAIYVDSITLCWVTAYVRLTGMFQCTKLYIRLCCLISSCDAVVAQDLSMCLSMQSTGGHVSILHFSGPQEPCKTCSVSGSFHEVLHFENRS